jgi:hypothetical protein
VAEYITHREATVSPGAVRINRERLPALKRVIGNRAVRDITGRLIRDYQAVRDITGRLIRDYQALRAKEVSPRTENLEVKLLLGILQAEGRWKRLAEDVKPLRESGETHWEHFASSMTLPEKSNTGSLFARLHSSTLDANCANAASTF